MYFSIKSHALERFKEHYPFANKQELYRKFLKSNEISADLVSAVTQSSKRKNSNDRYYVHHNEGKNVAGIFVVCDDQIITYLRLENSQKQILFGKPLAVHTVEYVTNGLTDFLFHPEDKYQMSNNKISFSYEQYDISVSRIGENAYKFKVKELVTNSENYRKKLEMNADKEFGMEILKLFVGVENA